MPPSDLRLAPGDLVEIKYRNGRTADGAPCDRWYRAWVIETCRSSWPLVRLSDGQLTEIRPFMPWRMIERAAEREQAAA